MWAPNSAVWFIVEVQKNAKSLLLWADCKESKLVGKCPDSCVKMSGYEVICTNCSGNSAYCQINVLYRVFQSINFTGSNQMQYGIKAVLCNIET